MKSDILLSDVDQEQQKPDDNNNDSKNSSYDDRLADDVLNNVVTMAEDKIDRDYFSSSLQSLSSPSSPGTSSLADDFDDMDDFYGTGSFRSSYSLGCGNGNGICRPTMISGKYRQKEERRKVMKLTLIKLRRIEDLETAVLRSVLLNNTVKLLQQDVRDEKKPLSISACSIAAIAGNSPSQSKCFGITNDFITKQQGDNLKNSSDELSFLTSSAIDHRANEQLLDITNLHDNPSSNKSASSSPPATHSSSPLVASSSAAPRSTTADELTSNTNEDDERIIVQSIAQNFDLPSSLELSATSLASNISTGSASLVTSTISSSSSCPLSSSAGSLSSSTVNSVQPHHHQHHHHQQQQQPNRKRSIEDNESSLVDDCDIVLNQFYLQACAIPTKILSTLDEDEDEDVNVVDIDTSPPISVDLVDYHSSSIKRRRCMSPSDCCKTAADRLRDNISSSSPLLMPPFVTDDWSSSMLDDDAAAVFMQPNLLSPVNCMSHGQQALTVTTSPHQSGNFSCGHSSLLNEIVVYHNLIASLES